MHDHCEHKKFSYCEKCDVVYCPACKKEWRYSPYTYTTTAGTGYINTYVNSTPGITLTSSPEDPTHLHTN